MRRPYLCVLLLASFACKPIPDGPTGPSSTGSTNPSGRLAYVGTGNQSNLQVLLVFPDGSDPVSPINGSFNNVAPAWSPDGTRLVYASNRGTWDIYTVVLATGEISVVVESPRRELAPVWSPDGSRIAFERQIDDGSSDIFIVNLDGSGEINVTNSLESERNPTWSPDGTKIAFEARDSDGQAIDVIKTDGAERVRLTGANGEWNGVPVWSPDGRRILFESTKHQGPLIQGDVREYEVFLMDADGSNVSRVTGFATTARSIRSPSWAPDGNAIAFESRDETQFANTFVFRIWTMNLDGSGLQEIVVNGTARFPRWSPL